MKCPCMLAIHNEIEMGVRIEPLTMKMVAVNAVVMLIMLFLFPAVSLVTEGILTRSTDTRDRASILAGGEDVNEARWKDRRYHIRNVRAHRLHALVSDGDCNGVAVAATFRLRRMGPLDRPVKLVIICADRGFRKVGSLSPRGAPANQHIVPFENKQRRRTLKQLQVPPLPLQVPPLPVQVPPLPVQVPPLPFTLPSGLPLSPPPLSLIPPLPPLPQLQIPPLPALSVLPKPLNFPPFPPTLPSGLPLQIPCVPSSTSKSLPLP